MRLTEPLPLRQTTEWTEYQTIEPLPLRYGRDVWGQCIPYSQDLRRWVWAGHASQVISAASGPIDVVTVDGIETAGYTSRNVTDSAGKPVTMIILSEGLDPGRQVHARGRGAVDDNGALIENPAEVLLDLARIHGATLTRSDVTQLAQECTARNLRLSMSVTGTESLGAIASRLAEQLCGVFSPALAGWLRLLPLASSHAPLVSVADVDLGGLAARRDQRAGQITARYGYRLGEPTQTIVLRDQGAVDPVNVELEFDAIADVRAVIDVAGRMLARQSRNPVEVSADVPGLAPPGTPVAIESTALGVTSTVAVVSGSYDPDSDRTAATIEVPLSNQAVTVEIVSTSEQVGALSRTVLAAGPSNPLEPIIINGDNGPLVGARVTLDGTVTRLTDASGAVTFNPALLTPGVHVFDVNAEGYPDFTFEQTF